MLAQCSTGLIVLSPPASHYDHYDSMRLQLYEFVLDFQRAANRSVGEQVFVIADESARRDLLFGYGVADAIHGKLDDIWLRDLLVTQLSDTRVVRFRYRPAYLSQMLVSVVDTSTRALVGSIWPGGEVQPLDTLVLDGGGIVWEPSTLRAVVTERVLRDNPWLVNRTSLSADGKPPRPTGAAAPYADAPSISVAELAMARERLEALLSAALVGQEAGSGEVGGFDVTVAIVPEEDGAPRLGHVDGICNWLGPNTLALSAFAGAATYAAYVARLADAFGAAVTIVPFPYHPSASKWSVDGFESARGIYVNFARTEHAVYVPTFGDAEADAEALALVAKHSDRPPVAVNASAVAVMGGSVRCLSTYLWGAPAAALVARKAGPPTGAPPPPVDGNSGPLSTVAIIAGAMAGLVAVLVMANVAKSRRMRGNTLTETRAAK